MPNPIVRALISVSDKTGLEDFARFLADAGVAILSTGGTARRLQEAGIAVTEVSAHTGFPEMMDGRVKTLHPMIHGGILALRDESAHIAAMDEHGIAPIDLVVVNLYPFEDTLRRGASYAETVEMIDIGGPAMIRAAAKNHSHVTVVVDAEDYGAVMEDMAAHGGAISDDLRRHLASVAYARTAAYDAAIGRWLAGEAGDAMPRRTTIAGVRQQALRYGENPHQAAALYADPTAAPGITQAEQLQGKELSYNNLNDADAALDLVREFSEPAIVIVKHANPCGVALGASLSEAYQRALACDQTSAFGGIIAANRTIDVETARAITALFAEVVVAPDIDEVARAVFAEKKNLRVLATGDDAMAGSRTGSVIKALSDGFLVQGRDEQVFDMASLESVTKRAPTAQERADLLFAFTVCKHVKSNAIVYAKNGATVGVGAGQMSRVDSSRIAAWKAAEAAEAAGEPQSRAIGSVVASDAFFPFPDGLIAAAEAGATAVIQPGGSVRDAEVIAAADERDLAMLFTGMRHFRH